MIFELKKILARKSFVMISGSLFLSMIIYTIILLLGTAGLNHDYLRAGVEHIDSSITHYYFPYSFGYRLPDPIFSVYSILLMLFIVPILLTLCGMSSYYEDTHAKMINPIVPRSSLFQYVFNKLTVCFVFNSILVFASLILQISLATLAVWCIKSPVIHFSVPAPDELLMTLSASIRISIYYASLMTLSFAFSLFFAKFKYVSLFIPILLSIILVFISARSPLALAFVDSGLIDRSRTPYLQFIVISAVIELILSAIHVGRNRKAIL